MELDSAPMEVVVVKSAGLRNKEGHQLEGVVPVARRGFKKAPREPTYLAWNDHGYVTELSGEPRRVEVSYSRQSGNPPQSVANNSGWSMAALSADLCCLAAGADAEGGSQLVVRPAEPWEKVSFTAALGQGETAEAVACGDGFAAALTSQRFLRVFSKSAMPLSVVSVPGPGVALAAAGPLLLAVTQLGNDEDAALEYRLFDVRARAQRAQGRLPLSPGAKLRWLGFSAERVPLAIDSKGSVRAMLGSGAGSWGSSCGGEAAWMPVLSLAAEEAKVGSLRVVHAEKGKLFCAESAAAEESDSRCGYSCKLREFDWQIPVGSVAGIGPGSMEVALREQLFAHHTTAMIACGACTSEQLQQDPTSVGRNVMKRSFALFGELVMAGEEERALDVTRAMLTDAENVANVQPLQMAAKFAEKAGKHRLADEITALAEKPWKQCGATQGSCMEPAAKAARVEIKD